jgi:twitching motility protein PilU
MNLAVSLPAVGRFRINIFRQRNEVSIVARYIVTDIPQWDELGLPEVLTDLILRKRGLILFVGATGSGKSTSLAAMIDYRNTQASGHIVTIEDPVEFVHQHKKSIVNQREVGVDTRNWHNALKNTLCQAPDVILIGEIRDRETIEHALSFAETGHLCISTLHANNANQALDRIINFFSSGEASTTVDGSLSELTSLCFSAPDTQYRRRSQRRGGSPAGVANGEGVNPKRRHWRPERDHGEIKRQGNENLRYGAV